MVASDADLFVFVLCPLNILPVKADDGDGAFSHAGELRGWPTVLFLCRCCPVNRSADRKTLIRISLRTLIKDPRLQSTAISNL